MYVGRPLLVTANDYATGVVNGDTGVVVAAPTEQGVPSRARRARRVAVIAGAEAIRAGDRVTHPPTPSSGAYRTFAPSRLGDVLVSVRPVVADGVKRRTLDHRECSSQL